MPKLANVARGYLVVHLVVFFAFTLPVLLLTLDIYRFDYAVNTATAYVVLLAASSPIIVLVYKGLRRRLLALQDRVAILCAVAATCWAIIFLLNQIYWASDSVLLSIVVVTAFLVEFTLVYFLLKETPVALATDKKSLLIGIGITGAGALSLFVDFAMFYVVQAALMLGGCLLAAGESAQKGPGETLTLSEPVTPEISFPSSRAAHLHTLIRACLLMGIAAFLGSTLGPLEWFLSQWVWPFLCCIAGFSVAFGVALYWLKPSFSNGVFASAGCLLATAAAGMLFSLDPILTPVRAMSMVAGVGAGLGFFIFDLVATAPSYFALPARKLISPSIRLHGTLLFFFLGSMLGYWLIGFLYAGAHITLELYVLMWIGAAILLQIMSQRRMQKVPASNA